MRKPLTLTKRHPKTSMKFSDMGLHPRVLEALVPLGYESPPPFKNKPSRTCSRP